MPNNTLLIVDAKFTLGQCVVTTGVSSLIPESMIEKSIQRHASGDWGDICEEDRGGNEHALKVGNRVMSVYKSDAGDEFWIITESDRSVTTVLMPDEY